MPPRLRCALPLAALLVVAVGLCSARAADPVGAVKDKLFEAKKEYDGEARKFRRAVAESLDKREAAARKTGDQKVLDQVAADRDRFDKEGEIPADCPTVLRTQLSAARAKLDKAFATAVRDYVRLREDAAAEATEKEQQKVTLETAFLLGRRTPLATLGASDVKVWKKMFKKGTTFKVDGVAVPQSILMHADVDGEARASFALSGKQTALKATVGVPKYKTPQYEPASPITFEILGDGKVIWKSEPVTKLDTFQSCIVSVAKVKTLTLRASCRDQGWAHAAWLAPILAE